MPGFKSASGGRSGDQRDRVLGIVFGNAGAGEHVAETVAMADGGGALLDRALGCFGERYDKIVRGHMPPAIGAPGERRDRLRACFLAVRAGQRRGGDA